MELIGAKRCDIEDIGVYSLLTNKYCVLYTENSERIYSNFENEINSLIPIIHSSLSTIGVYCVGNSKGLLIPKNATDIELRHLTNSVPDGTKVRRIDERLNTLGNHIVCNDKFAIVNHELSGETIRDIEEVLGVEVIPHRIAGESLIGTYVALSNKGALVHPKCTVADQEELNNLIQIPVVTGSVNHGSAMVGKGCVVNDFAAFCGKNTTSLEINVIENIFRLNQSGFQSEYSDAMKSGLLEQYIN